MALPIDMNTFSEAAHWDSAIEWWFVHGVLELEQAGEVSFFLSFFRYLLEGEKSRQNGYMLLQFELEHGSSISKTRCLIDKALFASQLENQEFGNLDTSFCKKLIEENREFGPFGSTSLSTTVPEVADVSFNVKWEDFSFSHTPSQFELSFKSTLSGEQVSLTLTPQTSIKRIHGEDNRIGGMCYRSCPELKVSGSWGDQEAAGQAWYDHQWGNTDWLMSSEQPRQLRGWDWWGVTLDNGTTMIIVSRWDAKTKTVCDSSAVLWSQDGQERRAAKVHTHPLDYWTSTSTRITYPIAWRIEIPEFKAEISFSPTAPNQEAPVFGLMRGIWEGHGRCSGSIDGEAVSGWARAEHQGYGYLFSIDEALEDFGKHVEKHLENVLPRQLGREVCNRLIGPATWQHEPVAYESVLCDPVWDLLDRKGKCWRPAFGMLILETLGISAADYEELVCAMAEFIHAGSLIIDDIEDSALLRRGQEAIHLKYGINTAINAGNSLYFLPIQQVFEHPLLDDTQKLEILRSVNTLQLTAHFGQGTDIYWSNNLTTRNLQKWLEDSLQPKVLQMYAQKTAAGVAGLAECAAIVARCDADKKALVYSFARDFGVAFQLIDDVHDYSVSSKWRKSAGEDFREGKLTYVLTEALKCLSSSKQSRLIEIFCSKELRTSKAGHEEGMELVRSSGAFDTTKQRARTLFDSAWQRLSSDTPSSESRFLLKVLSQKLISLDYEN